MKIHVEEKTSDENPKGISISQDQNSEKRGFALQHPLENDRNTLPCLSYSEEVMMYI